MKVGKLVSDAEKQAERGLVGFAMFQPTRALELDLEPHHFSEPRWERAWAAIRELVVEGHPVDEVTVADRMEREGGSQALCDLAEAMLTPCAVPDGYVDVVKDGWITREVLRAHREIYQAHAEGSGGMDLLNRALERIASIHVEQPGRAGAIGQIVKDRYRQLAELAEAKAKGQIGVTGIPTGVRELDELIGGLQLGICTTVAARPGMGKSSFGMTVVDFASERGVGCHAFNMEDSEAAYADRSVSRISMVPAESIRVCELDRGSLQRIGGAAQKLHERKGWIVDSRGGLTAEEIVRSVRRDLGRNGTKLVVVDYVQLLRAPPGFEKPGDKTAVADHAMNVLADAAKRDNMAYLVLAQLNRECEKRDNKRPILSDLKQSGAIEERSKAVIMLYRPSVYREKDERGDYIPESVIEILVRKNNHGRTGKVLAEWHGPTTRID